MLKPIKISPLNKSNVLKYSCKKCGKYDELLLEKAIDVNNGGDPIEPLIDYECPNCQADLTNN